METSPAARREERIQEAEGVLPYSAWEETGDPRTYEAMGSSKFGSAKC